MDWHDLKSRCIDHVALDCARVSPEHNQLPFEERRARWLEAHKAAQPEAARRIEAMSPLELLDLLSEVMGQEQE